MKNYDLIVRRKREMELPVRERRHEYKIDVRNRRNIDLIVENLPNRIAASIHHVIRLTEDLLGLSILGGRYTSVSHPIRISVSDIGTHLSKTVPMEDHALHLATQVSAFIGQDVSMEGHTIRMCSAVSAETSRLRLLSDVDTMTLGEMDGMTLEELDYLKG